MYVFLLLVEKIKIKLQSGQPFHLLTKTCKYGDSVFGTVAAGGAQTEYPPKMGLEYFRLINNCHKLVITADKMQLWGPK